MSRSGEIALRSLLGVMSFGTVQAETLFVNASAAAGGDGTSWSTAHLHLQEALAAAQGSGGAVTEIWVATGTYMPDGGLVPVGGMHTPGDGDRTATFQLLNGVAVYGGFAGNEDPETFDLADRDFEAHETILSGDLAGNDGPDFANNGENSFHVVTGSGTDETAILEGFTITGGNADGPSTRAGGGAMHNDVGSPTVTRCTFRKNRASRGGAMFNTSNSNPTVINSVFGGNVATQNGGAIYNRNSSGSTVINCTFIGNTAIQNGGGVYSTSNSNLTLVNCILWKNSPTQIQSGGGSVSLVRHSLVQGGWSGEGNIHADPLFVRMPDPGPDGEWGTDDDDHGDLRLQFGSPAIDAGDNEAVPPEITTDLDGNPRVVDGTGDGLGVVDMGAYEFQLPERLFVDASAAPDGDGLTWATAFQHLQTALSATASFGGSVAEIWVAEGTYMPDGGFKPVDGIHLPGTGNREATFQLVNGVALRGGFAGHEDPATFDLSGRDFDVHQTILSGDLLNNDGPDFANNNENSLRVVTGSGTGPTAILDGFIVSAGWANRVNQSRGAGIYNDAGSPTVTNCTFSGNKAIVGGGMFNINSSHPTVVHCIFSGNSALSGGGMYNEGSSPTVRFCTFTLNEATGSAGRGGGMYNEGGSSPTVAHCTFNGNAAVERGGGMANFSSSNPTVTECIFSGNGADYGGGMANHNASSPTVTDCTFAGNSGGGMRNSFSSPTVTHCTFAGNTLRGGISNSASNPLVAYCTFNGNSTDLRGGGMYSVQNSNPTVTHCTFNGNTAGLRGGGMYNGNNSLPTVTNCTFSGNRASDRGGGMANAGSSPTLTNCTFSGNSARFGGAVFNDSESNVTVRSSILWGNTSPQIDLFGDDASVIRHSLVQGGWPGEGNIHADPLFVRMPDPGPDGEWGTDDDDYGDLRLQPDSPCIDAGDNTAVPPAVTTDLDGNPRVIDGIGDGWAIVDMGAYEMPTPPLGACCLSDGSCEEALSSGFCAALSGTFQGDETFCDEVTCPQPVVCCLPDGTCDELAASACAARLGTNRGDDTSCPEVDCPKPPDRLFVSASAAADGDGRTWTTAFQHPQTALGIAAASGGAVSEIWVAQGTYMPDGGFVPVGGMHMPGEGDRTATFQLLDGVAFYGGFAGHEDPATFNQMNRDFGAHETILSGDLLNNDGPDWAGNEENSYHVVTGSGTGETAVLDGFTITGGNANYTFFFPDERGAGMVNVAGNPTVTHCVFRGNWADGDGGGMHNSGSSPTVTYCIFSTNATGGQGAGMANADNSNPLVTHCNFSGNSTELGAGGGMANLGSDPIVTHCVFNENSARRGGGMYNESGSSPTLTHCTFTVNTATDRGGGVSNQGNCNPAVTHCVFDGNAAHRGGGMHNANNSEPTVVHCSFKGNSAQSGGGMYNEDSSPSVSHAAFTENEATGSFNMGGGMYNTTSSLTLKNCTFIGNKASNGGGIRNENNSNTTLVNCIFSVNQTWVGGGGVSSQQSSVTLTNCTLIGNTAAVDHAGGGMYEGMQSNATVINCILWDNTPAQIARSGAAVPMVSYSLVQGGWSGEGNIHADPLFVRMPDPGPDGEWGTDDDDYGDLRLQPDSPCIDAGDNTAVPADVADLDGDGDTDERTPIDIAGKPRFIEDPDTPDTGVADPPDYLAIVDMGAHEYDPFDDYDGDGVPNIHDNCPTVYNPDQLDVLVQPELESKAPCLTPVSPSKLCVF